MPEGWACTIHVSCLHWWRQEADTTDILALVSLGEQQLKQQTGSINRLLLSDLSNLFFFQTSLQSPKRKDKNWQDTICLLGLELKCII